MTPEERLGVPIRDLAAALGLEPDAVSGYLTADLSAPKSETNRKPDKTTAIRILEGIETLRKSISHPTRRL